MLRVLFNASPLRQPMTGVGQYTLQLARALMDLGQFEFDFFYGNGHSRELRCEASARRGAVRTWVRRRVPRAYEIRRFLEQRSFDRCAAGHDLYHEPATLPLAYRGATIVTAHDLSWIRHPEMHPPERVRALARYFEPGLRSAALVLTGSEYIKRELVDTFGLAPQAIEVIPHGCDPAFRPMTAQQTQGARSRHGLDHGGYFLSVGTLEPRKNLRLALQAHAALPAPLRSRHPLVLTGMKGWGPAAGGPQLAAQLAAGEVRVTGYLERNDLACLTAGALALVYPSLYEGFGLPPLEAMACGVPPITSNATSLPEVVGEAGIMVDPQDVQGLSRAMEQLAMDPALRSELAARSLSRAAGFTWPLSAQATAAAYRRVAGAGA